MYNPIPSTYLTIAEHQRRLRMSLNQISKTSLFSIPQEGVKRSSKPFEPNGDITKIRWKIMA